MTLRIFDRTMVAASEMLRTKSSKINIPVKKPAFITIVQKLCNIVNVKSTTKGIHKGLEDANVIIDTTDRRLQWL